MAQIDDILKSLAKSGVKKGSKLFSEISKGKRNFSTFGFIPGLSLSKNDMLQSAADARSSGFFDEKGFENEVKKILGKDVVPELFKDPLGKQEEKGNQAGFDSPQLRKNVLDAKAARESGNVDANVFKEAAKKKTGLDAFKSKLQQQRDIKSGLTTDPKKGSLDAFKSKLQQQRDIKAGVKTEKQKSFFEQARRGKTTSSAAQKLLDAGQAKTQQRRLADQTPAPIAPTAPAPTTTPVQQPQPGVQGQVEPTTPQRDGRVQEAIDFEKGAQKDFKEALQQPAVSSLERFKKAQEAAGRPQLIQGRQETLGQITRVNNLLRNLQKDVVTGGQDVGLLQAGARRIEAKERAPLTEQLQTLNDTFRLQNLKIEDVDDNIEKLIKFGQQDEADKLSRLKQLASLSGLSDTERDQIAAESKAALESAKAVTKQKEADKSELNKGINALRKIVTDANVITPKFQKSVVELEGLVQSGEISVQEGLAGLAAAVASNPTLKAKARAELQKLQKSAKTGVAKDKGQKLSVKERLSIGKAFGLTKDNTPATFEALSPEHIDFLAEQNIDTGTDSEILTRSRLTAEQNSDINTLQAEIDAQIRDGVNPEEALRLVTEVTDDAKVKAFLKASKSSLVNLIQGAALAESFNE
jgi:hypothetical protein